LKAFRCPVLVVGGSEDLRTTLADTKRLFNAAVEPKELWIVKGASHEDFHAFTPDKYERRIFAFIRQALSF
jgi:fermentation-respiration switch protein FrsA (DUF1100 family)